MNNMVATKLLPTFGAMFTAFKCIFWANKDKKIYEQLFDALVEDFNKL